MKTSLQITEYLFKLLNRQELLDVIDGKIYRQYKTQDSELQDIVVNCTFLKSSPTVENRFADELQNGMANINIYCKNINGMPNITKLNEISSKVIELLQDNTQSNKAFSYEVMETQIFREPQQNTMSFLNIKLQIHKY